MIADYESAYDYEVITAVQRMFMPVGKGDAGRAGKIDVATVVDAHKFMAVQMESLVAEFNQLPSETKHSIPKKERERSAELMVSVAVESSFKLQSEDLELAVTTYTQQLEGDPAFVECQNQIGSFMQLLMEPPFVDKVVAQSSKLGNDTPKASVSVNPVGSSLCLNIGIASTLGLAVLLGLLRWRANQK